MRYRSGAIATIALAAAATACQPTDTQRTAPAVDSTHVRPGTYTLHLCRVTCDPSVPRNEIRRGWVVLDSAPIQLELFPDSIRKALEMGAIFIRRDGPGNGCFRLLQTRPDVETYAGIEPGGLLHWSTVKAGDSVTFALYRSPDAGHEVTIRGTQSGFSGTGESWGAGAAAVDYPPDIVVGEYVGPPEPARCAEAGLAFAAMLRDAK